MVARRARPRDNLGDGGWTVKQSNLCIEILEAPLVVDVDSYRALEVVYGLCLEPRLLRLVREIQQHEPLLSTMTFPRIS